MPAITLDNITEAVINHGDKGKTNPRLHEIYSSLVKHLHAFQREVNLTTEELEIGRQFLFKLATPNQDFPMGEITLMTDCLGISETCVLLADDKNHGHGTTEMNVEGPLYFGALPERQQGDLIGEIVAGEKPLFVTHTVQDKNGKPLAGAAKDAFMKKCESGK